MNNNTEQLIPKLRFPEFKDDGEWEEKKLGKIFDFVRGPFGGALKKEIFVKEGYAVYEQSHAIYNDFKKFRYFIDSEKKLELSRFKVKAGDIIMSCSGTMGKFAIIPNSHPEGIINQALLKLTTKNNFFNIFAKQLLELEQNLNKLLSQSAGGAIKNVVGVSEIKEIKVHVPQDVKEQQKIADCLTSLDDLITAQEEKVQLLQGHKKGLMQNLFPKEGQTKPEYRFPEFENEGDWEEKKLGEIGDPLMCKRIFKDETVSNKKGNIPFYKIGTFGSVADAYITPELFEGYKNKFSYPKVGDILISASGTIGRLVVFDGEPSYFQDSNIVWVNNDETNIYNSFLYYCYQTLTWQTSDGGVIRRLYNSDLKNMDIIYPSNKLEQQKIAECLLSIDNLIVAETNRIKELKQHKKGLMQGLFPTLKE